VYKHVRSVFTADEAETLRVVEPLYGSFQFHFRSSGRRTALWVASGAVRKSR
jgi:hypothetical protein